MGYNLLKNGCEDGYRRYKWSCLGRTGASQSSHAIDELGRAFGWGQNNDFEAGVGDYIDEGDHLKYIELATQIGVPGRCIKICSGEYGSLAINHLGELYGWGTTQGGALDNCASFALPHNSGSHGGDMFATPTRAAPGYLFKDISFDFYHAAAIGMDNKLYTWGYDNNDGALGLGPGITSINVPTINPTLTDDIKLVDSELLNSVAVTTDDKVYLWGTWWNQWSSYTPIEVIGLVIPPGETIVSISCSYLSIIVLLSNGEVWGAGDEYIYGDQGATGDSTTFKQITCFANPIVLAKTTALGLNAVVVIDDQGDIYGWSDGIDEFLGNDPSPSPDWELPNLIASEYPGQHKWVDVILNTHNSAFQAIDDKGWLWTWGWQGWGPHLATNTVYSQYYLDMDPNVEGIVAIQSIASLASPAVDAYGDPAYLNNLRPYESEYFQPLPQTIRHKPCGHWHLREFWEEEIYPKNCWMPSLAIKDNILLFAATGKWAKDLPGSGNEVLMFTYDMDANLWEFVMYEEGYAAANAPGGAAIDSDILAYANWKADQTGSVFNEVYTNYGIGVWVIDTNTDTMNYTYFADSAPYMYMANKIAVFAGGVVVIAYHDNTAPNPQLIVRVSTDYGATWNLVKTVQGAADFERGTLTDVIEARAKATSTTIDANNLTPEKMAAFQEAQNGLTGALSKLMVVVERYPELKANQNFLELQSQLEGTENRINVERNNYNEKVNIYDIHTTKFPGKLLAGLFGFEEMVRYKADEGSEQAPDVNFEFN